MSAPRDDELLLPDLIGTCACGTEVARERAEGYGAHILNALPFVCARCLAQSVEEEREGERQEAQRRLECKLAEVLPPALRGIKLDQLDVAGRTKVLKAARQWAMGELRGIALIGPIGVGKTTIAAGTISAHVEAHPHGKSPRWINTVQALNDLGRDFKALERIDVMNALTSKGGPLVLDDIDKAKPNAGAAAILFGAIDACMTNERQLIVTTNLLPSELATKWPKPHGEAIASRLAGYCEMYRVTGRDRRLVRAA